MKDINIIKGDFLARKQILWLLIGFLLLCSIGFSQSIVNLTLNSTKGYNITYDNLTCNYNLNGTATTSAVAWYKNNAPTMLLYLPFEGNSTNALLDYSGNSNNGVNTGSVWNVSGGNDGKGAFMFNGTTDFINTTYAGVKRLDNWSVSTWIKFNNFNQDQIIWWEGVSGQNGYGNGDNNHVVETHLVIRAESALKFFFVGNEADFENTSRLSVGFSDTLNWHHVVIIMSNATTNNTFMSMYIDGVFMQNATGHRTNTSLWNEPFTMGRPGTNARYFNGSIDEVRIYNYSLSAEQIFALYNNRTDLIVSQELKTNDKWQCRVTPFSSLLAGSTYQSNNITILSDNPSIKNLILNSTPYNYNLTIENLTCNFENNFTTTTSAISWYVNSSPIQVLNLPFEGNFTNSLLDYSGNGFNGTNMSGVIWNSTGGFDGKGAYMFDGINDYINISTNMSTYLGKNATLVAWIKTKQVGSADQWASPVIIGIEQGGGGNDIFWGWIDNNGYIGIQRGDTAGAKTNFAINTNQWYHVAFTRNEQTGQVKVYVNGTLRDTQTSLAGVQTLPFSSIGRLQTSPVATDVFFNGSLDNVLVYNRILSDEQIRALYNNRTNLIVNNETRVGDVWQCRVTPFSSLVAGLTYQSNNVTINSYSNPYINSVTIYTTSGKTSNFVYLQTIDYINIVSNYSQYVDSANVKISIIKPDNTILVNNENMINTSKYAYTYTTDFSLDSTGTWTINVTINDSINIVLNITTFTVSKGCNLSISDGFFGFDTNSILNYTQVIDLSYYRYNVMGYTIKNSEFSNNWSKVKDALNYTLLQNGVSFIKINYNKGNYSNYTSECNIAQTNFTDLRNYPYNDAVSFIVIQVNNTGVDNKTKFINEVARCIRTGTYNLFPIYSELYNASLDNDYVDYWNMNRISETGNLSQSLLSENGFLRNSTSLTRIYNGSSDEFKQWSYNYYYGVLANLRSSPLGSSQPTDTRLAKLSNGDLVLFNSETNKTINLNLSIIAGTDVWDYSNKEFFKKVSANINLSIKVANYTGTVLFVDNYSSIIMSSNSISSLYKESVNQDQKMNYYLVNGSNPLVDGTFSIVGAYDTRTELWNPDYGFSNLMFHTYEVLNYTQIVDFSPYELIVIAGGSSNPPSVVNTTLRVSQFPNILNRTFGYISVADYNNTNSTGHNITNCSIVNDWETMKKGEMQNWIFNYSVNIFMDGLDIGYYNAPACFEERLKRLADNVRIGCTRKIIFNTYTIYQSVANYGDIVMRESCFSRWSGSVGSPEYAYEDMGLMINNANYMKVNGMPMICMAFGDINDYDKMMWDYLAFSVVYGTKTSNGLNNTFRYAQPNFQTQREIRVPNLGTMMQYDYDDSNPSDWTRRYGNGIVHISPYRNYTYANGKYYWFDNGKTINNLKIKGQFQVYGSVCSADHNLYINVNDGTSQVIDECTEVNESQWYSNWVTKDFTTDYSYAGHYYVRLYPVSRAQATGMNVYNKAGTWAGVHSWYDTSINNPPSSETGWTAYGRTGNGNNFNTTNFQFNISLNHSTRTNIDYGITSILQSLSITGSLKTYNMTLSSSKDYNITILSNAIFFNSSRNHTVKYAGQVLNYSISSDCNTTNPTFNYSTINGELHGVCRINVTDGYIYRFSVPHLSEQSYYIEELNSLPSIPSLTANESVYAGQTITASASGSTDIDNDTISYYYEFYNINDTTTIQAYSTTNTYTTLYADIGDIIRVRAKAYDGFNYSLENETNTSVGLKYPYIKFESGTSSATNNLGNVSVNISFGSEVNTVTATIFLYNSTYNEVSSYNPASSPYLYIFTGLSDGIYFFNASTEDSIGLKNNTEIRNATIDLSNPQISIQSPTATYYNSMNISLNYTAYDLNRDKCWYNLNGANNVSLSNCNNITFLGVEVLNNLTVYMNDSTTNINSTFVNFTIDTITPSIEYVTPTETHNSYVNRLYLQINTSASDTNFANQTINIYNSSYDLIYSEFSINSNLFINLTNNSIEGICTQNQPNVSYGCADSSGSFNIINQTACTSNGCYKIVDGNLSSQGRATTYNEYELNYTIPSGSILSRIYLNNSNGDIINLSQLPNECISDMFSIFHHNPSFNGSYMYWYCMNYTSGNYDIFNNYNTSYTRIKEMYVEWNFNSTSSINLIDDIYYFNSTAYDLAGNSNTTNTRNVTIDTTYPIISIQNPTQTIYNYLNITLNYTITELNLDSCKYELNGQNNVTIENCGNTTFLGVEGLNNLTVYVNDSAGNINSSFINFTIDVTLPSIIIYSPENLIYSTNNITINFSATDNFAVDKLWFNNGTENISYTESITKLFSEGNNTIIFYANDTAGNINQSNISFYIDLTIPSIQYMTPTELHGSYVNRLYLQINTSASDTNFANQTIYVYNSTGNLLKTQYSTQNNYFLNYTETANIQSTPIIETHNYNSQSGGFFTSQNFTIPLGCYNYSNSLEITTTTNLAYADRSNFYCKLQDNSNEYIGTWTGASGSGICEVFIFYNESGIMQNYGSDYSENSLLNDSNTTTCTLVGNHNFIYDIPVTQLTQGTYYFNATTYDLAGNLNSTETRNVTIDTIIPSIEFTSPTLNSGNVTAYDYIEINITGTDSNLKNITVYLYNSTKGLKYQNYSVTSPFFINYTNLSKGTYYFNATVYDLAGYSNDTETRNVTSSYNFTIISVTAPATNYQNYKMTLLANIYNDFKNLSYVQANITLPDATTILQNLTKISQIANTSVWQLNYTTLQTGTYRFKILANDQLSTIEYDTLIQTIVSVKESSGGGGSTSSNIGNITSPILKIEAKTDDKYYLPTSNLTINIKTFINNTPTDFWIVGARIIDSFGVIKAEDVAVSLGNGTYKLNYELTNLPEGDYIAQIEAYQNGEKILKDIPFKVSSQANLITGMYMYKNLTIGQGITVIIIISAVVSGLIWLIFRKKKNG